MKYKIFIDGREGTTGLGIAERLAGRSEFVLNVLPEDLRKDESARAEAIANSDVTILCLPDDAAQCAVKIAPKNARIIDASTAHRTAAGWTYGFPELNNDRPQAIAAATRVANPGCHASGFIAAVAPLVQARIVDKTEKLTCFSLTGYSGGGKKMIAEYEAAARDRLLGAPRQYAFKQQHKHIKEMTVVTGLAEAPVFCPVVAPFYSGMSVTVALADKKIADVEDALRAHYAGSPLITVGKADGYVSALEMSGFDDMKILVGGTDGRVTVTALFDNLGKGASGAAVQNLNIMLGFNETSGLKLSKFR